MSYWICSCGHEADNDTDVEAHKARCPVYVSMELIERAPQQHTGEVPGYRDQLEWLWNNCNIVYWPKEHLAYPIEHSLAAGKDSRALIESAALEDGETKPKGKRKARNK